MLHFSRVCVLTALLYSGAGPAYSVITSHEFSRYQVILDKKPFGEITPVEPVQPQVALGDVIAKDIEMKSIIDEGTSIRVGWLDKKTNKTFSLTVGETYEGLQLVSVNYDDESAVVKKGSETAVIRLHPDKDKDKAAVPGEIPPVPAAMAPDAAPAASPFSAAPTPPKSRRPFFSDLRTRRASPFRPVGTNTLPFQAKPLDSFFKVSTSSFPKAQSPFGPFQPVPGSARGANPFQAMPPGGTNAVNPFAPAMPAAGQVAPQNPNADSQSRGQTIDQLMQEQDANQPPAEAPVEEIAQ
jgi:hypothetical protein